ncbi:MAG: hypothetical protein E7463_09325 [Ruminococcaceae bacterium]|nr:hypothetical protein [Oscillospiraceae bacterium]
MKKRKDSFFGLHFDFHATPADGTVIGATLKESEIREICTELCPDFIQIDCKGHPGWASYPTELGNAMPDFAGDPLEVWRRVTREEGVALYLHYSGIIDDRYLSEHPEEGIVNADGTVSTHSVRANGRYVDALLIPQLSELAEKYGVDGVWIDGDCWGYHADFHPDTIAAFERETGISLGGKLPGTPADPYFYEYRDFCRELYRRYVRHYVDTLHGMHPDFQVASNWAFTDHMPEPISADVDFISGDLTPWNSFNSARYAGRAIAQHHYTWDLMSWNFRSAFPGAPESKPVNVTKHPVQILQEAASVISLGGGFQNYIVQYKDGSPHMDQIRPMKALADFMRQREPYCFRGVQSHEAALLLSTYDRSFESQSLYTRNGNEKVVGMTALLCDAGQSLEIVFEKTLLDNLAGYKLIVIPELYHGLESATCKALIDYAKSGGSLLLIGQNTCRIFAEAGLPIKIGTTNARTGQITQVADNGAAMEAGKTGRQGYFTCDGETWGALLNPGAVSAEGETIAWCAETFIGEKTPLATIFSCGEGRIGAVAADLGTQYFESAQYQQRDLIKRLCAGLYTPKARVEASCGITELVCLEKNGRLMVQLVNAGGNHANPSVMTEDFIPAVTDLTVSIALEKAPAAIVLQPEGRKLDVDYRDGRAYVSVEKLCIHGILEVIE